MSTPCDDFGPALLRGLGELGTIDRARNDLSLELGVSLWLRRSGRSLEEARGTLLEIRDLLLDAGGLDAATEPVPLTGRSARQDVLTLVAYLTDLLGRAASSARCGRAQLARRVAAGLPGREDRALGA